MNGLLLEQRVAGATTCLVVGELDACGDLGGYRDILWCANERGESAPSRLAGGRVHQLALHRPPSDRVGAIRQFLTRDPTHLPAMFVSESVLTADAAEYESAIAEICAELEHAQRVRATRQKHGYRWQQHIFQNLAAYRQRRLPATWRGALAGMPAFVCGAGPSLDVSAPALAARVRHGVVFAADSALRTLARHGIRADFAVSIDANKLPEKCLPAAPEYQPDHVALTTVSPPGWSKAVPAERQVFLSSIQATLDWLATHGVPMTPLSAHENCGNTALELARFLGCAPIYLFGLDMAVADENLAARNTADADHSVYAHSGYSPEKRLPRVPGNYADSVPTFALGDWRALDARLAGWPAGLVFNVNDRGARFRNTTVIRPAEFVPPLPSRDKADAVAALVAPESVREDAATARIRALGVAAQAEVPALRTALEQGPGALAAQWGRWLGARDAAHVFGAFTLKLAPHLHAPGETSPEAWRILLNEFAALAALAAAIAG